MVNVVASIQILGANGEYVPLLVAIMVIFSTAVFGFILPKAFEYNRNRYKDELKGALSIEKSLKERNPLKDDEKDGEAEFSEPELEEIIVHYKEKYISNRKEQITKDSTKKRWGFERSVFEIVIGVGAIIFVIAAVSVAIFALFILAFGQYL